MSIQVDKSKDEKMLPLNLELLRLSTGNSSKCDWAINSQRSWACWWPSLPHPKETSSPKELHNALPSEISKQTKIVKWENEIQRLLWKQMEVKTFSCSSKDRDLQHNRLGGSGILIGRVSLESNNLPVLGKRKAAVTATVYWSNVRLTLRISFQQWLWEWGKSLQLDEELAILICMMGTASWMCSLTAV